MRSFGKFAFGITLVSLVISPPALAFDSSGPNVGNKQYTRSAYTTIGTSDLFSPNVDCSPLQYPVDEGNVDSTCSTANATTANRYNYAVKIFHAATANAAGDTTDVDGTVRGVLVCPRTTTDDVAPTDLSGCVPSAWGPNSFGNLGWTKVRRAWSSAPANDWPHYETPEHMLVTKAAASLAGFDSTPLFTQIFWVRYPVKDEYVASPISGSQYAVGQSYVPQSFRSVGAHASRAIYLPELAQLPDASYAVWDWAAGNEVCPIDGMDGQDTPDESPKAFSSNGLGKYDVNNCHDFNRLMGGLNSSHFKLSAKGFWTYYHALAKLRMAQCKVIDQSIGPNRKASDGSSLPSLDQATLFEPVDPNTNYSTEAHECEREAFVFEMMAQHYLQDNWSTGHMWLRWGTPDLSGFTGTVPNPVGWTTKYPKENTLARSVILSSVIGAISGMIHGSKAVTAPIFGNFLNVTDDPLSGPLFPAPQVGVPVLSLAPILDQPVSWIAPGMTTPAAGVGDYFFSPDPFFGKASIMAPTATDQSYVEQQTRLLACAAGSLRDAYLSGSQVHGQLPSAGTINAKDVNSIAYADLSGDYCWGNYATNASMEGALGPLFLTRDWGQPLLGRLGISPLSIFNRLAASGLSQKLQAGVTYGGYPQNWVDDLMSLFTEGWVKDSSSLQAMFAGFRSIDESGTDAANLKNADETSATMLGVAPGVEKVQSNLINPIAPVAYADQVSPRTGLEQDQYVQRLFWRSHLKETCADVDASTLESLRSRCTGAAAAGGDPESCTACVEAAMPWIPICGTGSIVPPANTFQGTLDVSKCAALGVQPPSSFPADWSDPTARWVPVAGNADNSCKSAALTAIEYCTGTEAASASSQANNLDDISGDPAAGGSLNVDANDTIIANVTAETSIASACTTSDVGNTNDPLFTTQFRIALTRTEGDPSVPNPDVLVTAFDATTTEKETITTDQNGQNLCSVSRAVTTGAWDPNVLDPLPPEWDLQVTQAVPFLTGVDFGLGLQTCGTTQRETYWNRSCQDVSQRFPNLGALSSAPAVTPDSLNPRATAGAMAAELDLDASEQRCLLVEPRRFSSSCSNNATCNSASLCVHGTSASIVANYLSFW